MNAVKEEPQFFVNDFLAEAEQELREVVDALKERQAAYARRAFFLKQFTNNMFRAYVVKSRQWKADARDEVVEEIEKAEHEKFAVESYAERGKRSAEELRKELEEKKAGILARMAEMKGVKTAEPITKPSEGEMKAGEEIGPISRPSDGINPLAKPTTEKNLSWGIDLGEGPVPEHLADEKKDEGAESMDAGKNAGMKPAEKEAVPMPVSPEKPIGKKAVDFGIIRKLMDDSSVTEIVCDGAGKSIHLAKAGKHDVDSGIMFKSEDELSDFLKKLASGMGQDVDSESPFFMAEGDGFTVQGNVKAPGMSPRFVIEKAGK